MAVSVVSVMVIDSPSGLAEGEDVRTYAGVVDGDLEGARPDRPGLADKLVHPRAVDGALSKLLDVEAVRVAGRLTVEEHREAGAAARGRRREDQVEIPGVKAERDRGVRGAEHGRLLLDGPGSRHRPLIERELRRRVDAADRAAIADVGLTSAQRFPVGGLGETDGLHADGFLLDVQELLDRSLGRFVVALTEVAVAAPSLAVDEVDGGPGPV